MARRVFFSYHFDRDFWRANQVRQSWVAKPNREAAGFFDAADQEEVKRSSDEAIKRWIDSQLEHTSVTAVLIGRETASRKYVRYEIERSFERGNALLGIRIHGLRNREGRTTSPGDNPLSDYLVKTEAGKVRLSDIYPTYDWSYDHGRQNLSNWIQEAREADCEVPERWRQNLVHKEELSEATGIAGAVATGAALAVGLSLGAAVGDAIAEYLNQRRYR